MRTPSSTAAVAIVLVASGFLAACGDDDGGPQPPPGKRPPGLGRTTKTVPVRSPAERGAQRAVEQFTNESGSRRCELYSAAAIARIGGAAKCRRLFGKTGPRPVAVTRVTAAGRSATVAATNSSGVKFVYRLIRERGRWRIDRLTRAT
jgi:hypothetical protein